MGVVTKKQAGNDRGAMSNTFQLGEKDQNLEKEP